MNGGGTMNSLVSEQRKYFNIIKNDIAGFEGIGGSYSFRLSNLIRLKNGLEKHEKKLVEALKADLCKSEFEAVMSEMLPVYSELSSAIKHLKSWMKPERVRTPLAAFPGKSLIYSEPYGVTLVISPWNYPIQLPLEPLISSIAAGNCTILKLSELSPHSSAALADMIKDTFQECYVAAVQGDASVSTALLQEKFDYIFFTGSPRVGKIVMKAAAENLTPVTLELGGKSPCVVDKTADIALAAKRIVWGKFLNAGQTCIAPDYILAHSGIREKLIEQMEHYIKEFYTSEPLSNESYPKIINQANFDRLLGLIDGDKVVYGGRCDEAGLKIEPTIMTEITQHDRVMENEIFGPILPIIKYDNLSEVEDFINSRPKPLAFYVFTEDKSVENRLIDSIPFGGGCVNDTILHIISNRLPFGGVGNSGMGRYHGKFGFETFSHLKGVLKKASFLDIALRYPPVGNKLKYLRKLVR